jgi:hypothetical protein
MGYLTVNKTYRDTYIYAYPLVIMGITQNMMTHNGNYINTFVHISEFPTYAFKDIVRPNVDTLYSFAWLDLSAEPITLSVPATQGRYYLMELMDAWTNVFASLGKRTTGTNAQEFIIVGPQWHGEVPPSIKKIQAPTNMVLILARTQIQDKHDYAAGHKVQTGYHLTLFEQNRSPKTVLVESAIGTYKAPVDQVTEMDVEDFYLIFSQVLRHNPPAPADGPILALLKTIGIEPGNDFDVRKLAQHVVQEMRAAKNGALEQMAAKKDTVKRVHGWGMMFDIGTYGTDYLTRAMVAQIGIGANLPEDALYPTAFVDADGNPLIGTHNYVIHFDNNKLPPVRAFWSITMYNTQGFLIKNSLHRYALGDRDNLVFNADGSLDIFIQHASPGNDNEANWLPAPEGAFNVTMRLYWPQESVLQGAWSPPAIEKT